MYFLHFRFSGVATYKPFFWSKEKSTLNAHISKSLLAPIWLFSKTMQPTTSCSCEKENLLWGCCCGSSRGWCAQGGCPCWALPPVPDVVLDGVRRVWGEDGWEGSSVAGEVQIGHARGGEWVTFPGHLTLEKDIRGTLSWLTLNPSMDKLLRSKSNLQN